MKVSSLENWKSYRGIRVRFNDTDIEVTDGQRIWRPIPGLSDRKAHGR